MRSNAKIATVAAVVALVTTLAAGPVLAVPAAPFTHELTQPDGTMFRARQWGDERSHGWETEEGYTIVRERPGSPWTYAVDKGAGFLESSGVEVGRQAPPDLGRHLRPARRGVIGRRRPVSDGAVPTEPRRAVPASGTANVPVLLVNFSDRSTAYTTGDFSALLFGSSSFSMKDFYQEVSYGTFSVSAGPAGVMGWYAAVGGHDYYGADWTYEGDDRWPGTLVREAVAAADGSVDFGAYDSDGDCRVDVVNIVHQGAGQEASGAATDIWSHSWDLDSAAYWGYSDGGSYTTNDACPSNPMVNVTVNDYVIQSETLYGSLNTVGVFAHEFGHALGLPDLYDTDSTSNGIGNWGLMASGSWNWATRAGDRPAHPNAWCKYLLGWVSPTEVSGLMVDEQVTQAASEADVYKVLDGQPLEGEYFLVENRQKVSFDAGLPGAGLLVWHVDADLIDARMDTNSVNDDECWPASSSSCSSTHYGVTLVQADNVWGLERFDTDYGDTGDPYPGTTGNTSLTDETSPDTSLWGGVTSNVAVTDIGSSGSVMTATFGEIERIHLFAGNGTQAYSGDGGDAKLAALNYPQGGAIDAWGTLYLADTDNHVVRVIDTAGVISTVAGTGTGGFAGDGGPAVSALFMNPRAVALDAEGNLYVADMNNNRVRKVDGDGIVTTVAGDGTVGSEPYGDGGPATAAQLSSPRGLAVDGAGNLYISDYGHNRIRVVGADGVIQNAVSIVAPLGLAVDANDDLLIAESTNHRVRKLDTSEGTLGTVAGNGLAGFAGDGGPATSARLNYPYGVDLDGEGNLYIADRSNHRVRVVDGSGMITTLAGNGTGAYSGDGGAAVQASLNVPSDVVADGASNLFILDTGNSRMRWIARSALASFAWDRDRGKNPLTVTFSNATRSLEPSGTSYVWRFGDGSFSYAANPTHTFDSKGVYTVTLAATGNNGKVDTLVVQDLISVGYIFSDEKETRTTAPFTRDYALDGTLYGRAWLQGTPVDCANVRRALLIVRDGAGNRVKSRLKRHGTKFRGKLVLDSTTLLPGAAEARIRIRDAWGRRYRAAEDITLE